MKYRFIFKFKSNNKVASTVTLDQTSESCDELDAIAWSRVLYPDKVYLDDVVEFDDRSDRQDEYNLSDYLPTLYSKK